MRLGSIPARATNGPAARWNVRLTTDQEGEGSSPSWVAILPRPLGRTADF